MAILITTSRRTTRLLNVFVKELAARIPGSVKVQRGKSSWRDLAVRMTSLGCDRLIVVSRWKGGPRFVDMFALESGTLRRLATLYVRSYKLRQPKADKYQAETLAVELSPNCDFEPSAILRDFLASYLLVEALDISEPSTKLLIGYDEGYVTLSFFDTKTTRFITPMLKLDSFVLHERGYSWRCMRSE